ncbi:putative mitochondrial protein [Andalucia godoyi]|uniref:Putative mitochondrial protein n=1 Tax=Andalucia godoyi TaxID=505711 RepID=A0A8K0F4F0_ANDGO|nr:putative mitochondrial protein [Andalucia godoyi]|eukprot:ANDGO_04888.mRNA.1 putative mitochondrial protein
MFVCRPQGKCVRFTFRLFSSSSKNASGRANVATTQQSAHGRGSDGSSSTTSATSTASVGRYVKMFDTNMTTRAYARMLQHEYQYVVSTLLPDIERFRNFRDPQAWKDDGVAERKTRDEFQYVYSHLKQLRQKINDMEVQDVVYSDPAAQNGSVWISAIVTLYNESTRRLVEYQIVSPEEEDYELGMISYNNTLALQIMQKQPGIWIDLTDDLSVPEHDRAWMYLVAVDYVKPTSAHLKRLDEMASVSTEQVERIERLMQIGAERHLDILFQNRRAYLADMEKMRNFAIAQDMQALASLEEFTLAFESLKPEERKEFLEGLGKRAAFEKYEQVNPVFSLRFGRRIDEMAAIDPEKRDPAEVRQLVDEVENLFETLVMENDVLFYRLMRDSNSLNDEMTAGNVMDVFGEDSEAPTDGSLSTPKKLRGDLEFADEESDEDGDSEDEDGDDEDDGDGEDDNVGDDEEDGSNEELERLDDDDDQFQMFETKKDMLHASKNENAQSSESSAPLPQSMKKKPSKT